MVVSSSGLVVIFVFYVCVDLDTCVLVQYVHLVFWRFAARLG